MKNKTSEVQSKLTNAILVDVNKNQVSTFFQNFDPHTNFYELLACCE